MATESTEAQTENQSPGASVTVHPVVMTLQPCPHCETAPVDAFKKITPLVARYYIVFPDTGCIHCYGKTGVLEVFPLTRDESVAAYDFRVQP